MIVLQEPTLLSRISGNNCSHLRQQGSVVRHNNVATVDIHCVDKQQM